METAEPIQLTDEEAATLVKLEKACRAAKAAGEMALALAKVDMLQADEAFKAHFDALADKYRFDGDEPWRLEKATKRLTAVRA